MSDTAINLLITCAVLAYVLLGIGWAWVEYRKPEWLDPAPPGVPALLIVLLWPACIVFTLMCMVGWLLERVSGPFDWFCKPPTERKP